MKNYNKLKIKEYLSHCIVTPEAKSELLGYLDEAFLRIIATCELIPDIENGRILEIGANPYFLTILISRFKKYKITLINYFGENISSKGNQSIINEKNGDQFFFEFDHINIDKDPFPYPDKHFDVIIYGEVIEHLTDSPIYSLYNIHRVLKDNGILIVTTPNVFRFENLLKFLFNRKFSIYDPYSGYGIYGRHNREYSLFELSDLLEKSGFSISSKKTLSVKGKPGICDIYFKCKEFFGYGDYLILSTQKRDDFSWYFPNYLFRGVPRTYIIEDNIKMGKNCIVQIGKGFFDPERWEEVGGIRWTTKKATCFLKPNDARNNLCFKCYAAFDNFPISVRIFQDHNVIAEAHFSLNKEWNTEKIKLPEISDLPLEIEFDVEKTWIPKEINEKSSDSRELGIAINEVFLN